MSDSDIEIKSALPKKTTKKPPKSPTADLLNKQEIKKITTKEMIHHALSDLKSRKGTSLYAIKKYIEEKYSVDVEKISYIIKKYLKASVEMGTIVQTKGSGATGSFKLASGKDKLEKKKKKKIPKKSEKSEKSEKSKKSEKSEKSNKTKEKSTKSKSKTVENLEISEKAAKVPKKVEIKSFKSKEKKDNVKKVQIKKDTTKKKSKMAKVMQTPAKKRSAMMKRKSIGSIIKPPKMKPKAV